MFLSSPHRIASVCLAGATAALACGQMVDPAQINAALSLRAGRQVDLHVIEESDSHWLVETHLDGETVALFLRPYSLRAAGFEVLVQDGGGEMRRLESPPPSRTVRGTVEGWDVNRVVGSLVDGQFRGQIRTAERGTWFVQPLAQVAPGAPAQAHVAFRAEDVIADGHGCGVGPDAPPAGRALPRQAGDAVPGPRIGAVPASADRPAAAPAGEEPPSERGSPGVTEISFDSDVEFYQDNGSSVAATVDYIESMMVGVDDIYRAQAGISYVVNRIVIRTVEPDPYSSTDSESLLDQFRDVWESVFDAQERDLAHLMTGKDLDGSVIGRAYGGQVCNRDGVINPGGYGLSQHWGNLAQRVALTAHELGHNWDAGHCAEIEDGNCPQTWPPDCGIMCACLGGCNGSLTQFGQPSINAIVSHRNSRSCLSISSQLTYVNAAYSGHEEGNPTFPYNTFREGVWATDPGGTVILAGGTYDADRTPGILNRPLRLEAWPGMGAVSIGQ